MCFEAKTVRYAGMKDGTIHYRTEYRCKENCSDCDICRKSAKNALTTMEGGESHD